jgi:hypothetical protein
LLVVGSWRLCVPHGTFCLSERSEWARDIVFLLNGQSVFLMFVSVFIWAGICC